MKKLLLIATAVACVLLITALVINRVSAQSAKKDMGASKPIPQNVMKIAEKACVKCHAEPGNGMALAHVNLTNWDKYSPEHQAAKSKAMCDMVSKDKMPPKKFRENNPAAIPTKEDVKILCDWAESLQLAKK